MMILDGLLVEREDVSPFQQGRHVVLFNRKTYDHQVWWLFVHSWPLCFYYESAIVHICLQFVHDFKFTFWKYHPTIGYMRTTWSKMSAPSLASALVWQFVVGMAVGNPSWWRYSVAQPCSGILFNYSCQPHPTKTSEDKQSMRGFWGMEAVDIQLQDVVSRFHMFICLICCCFVFFQEMPLNQCMTFHKIPLDLYIIIATPLSPSPPMAHTPTLLPRWTK